MLICFMDLSGNPLRESCAGDAGWNAVAAGLVVFCTGNVAAVNAAARISLSLLGRVDGD